MLLRDHYIIIITIIIIQLQVCRQIISVSNSERILKIGQHLRKLCSNEKGFSFLTHSVRPWKP